MRCKEAPSGHGTTVIKTWDFSATCRHKRSKKMRSCIPARAFLVLFYSARLVAVKHVGHSQVGASSAQVEFARVSMLLPSFTKLCPCTARVRKTGLETRLDKVVQLWQTYFAFVNLFLRLNVIFTKSATLSHEGEKVLQKATAIEVPTWIAEE